MSTPAGWYPDPTGRHENRWFDGDDWTGQVADGQTVASDPVHGAGGPASTTQPNPTATAPQPAGAPPPPGAPQPGAPGTAGKQTYPGAPPSGPDGGNRNKVLLIVAAVVVVVVVAVGLVVALGGGDDGGDGERAGSSRTADEDEDDPPEDDDPTVSDLFDDMADAGDQSDDDVFGTDDERADDPGDATAGGDYPPEVIETFTDSCVGAGSSAAFCGCLIDYFQAEVAYDRFVEIDRDLAAGGETPQELIDAQASCR